VLVGLIAGFTRWVCCWVGHWGLVIGSVLGVRLTIVCVELGLADDVEASLGKVWQVALWVSRAVRI